MVATLLIWLYTFVLSFIYGAFCINLLYRIFRIKQQQSIPITVASIVGLCFLTTLSGFLSLILPLGMVANLLFVLFGVAIAIFQRKFWARYLDESITPGGFWRKFPETIDTRHQSVETTRSRPGSTSKEKIANLLIWLLFAALSLVVLAKTIEPPYNYDTGLYHAQAIHWIETYRAVPGLGNLANRLAFNSAWFLPSALFSFSFLKLRSFHVLGGLFFLMVNGYFLGKSSRLLQREYSLSNLISPTLIYLSRRLFGLELSSPGTDLPATLLTWIVFLLALEKIEAGKSDQFDLHSILILLFSSFSVTVKLSTAPILILPFYFLVRAFLAGRKAQVNLSLAFVLVVFAPWLIRNVILSGYLIYPVALLDLFIVDWKIPIAYVKDTANMVTSWARLPSQDSQIVLHMSYAEWLPQWWRSQLNFDRLLLVGIGVGSVLWLVIAGIRSFLDRKIPDGIKHHAILYLAGWVGLGFWFLSGPAFRFGYGFLSILLCLLIVPIVQWGLTRLKWIAMPVMYATIMVLLLYQAYGIIKMRDISQFDGRWILSADYPTALVGVRTLGGFDVNMPVNGDQCWYASLPCTPTHNPEVHLRGKELQDGFYNKYMRPTLPQQLNIHILEFPHSMLIMAEPITALH